MNRISKSQLESHPSIGKALGLKRLFVWRDDRRPGQVGGCKARNMEMHLAAMQKNNLDTLLIAARAGSNLAMVASRMAPLCGVRVVAVLRPQPDSDSARRNLAITHACGTEIIPVSLDVSLKPEGDFMTHLRRQLKKQGCCIYPLGFGVCKAASKHAHILAFENLQNEFQNQGLAPPKTIYMAAASFASGAGVAAGLARSGWPTELILVNIAQDKLPRVSDVKTMAIEALKDLSKEKLHDYEYQLNNFPAFRIIDRLRPGFGLISNEDLAATLQVTKALHLDKTYTAKAFAAMLEDLHTNRTGEALFWHSGVGAMTQLSSDDPIFCPDKSNGRLTAQLMAKLLHRPNRA